MIQKLLFICMFCDQRKLNMPEPKSDGHRKEKEQTSTRIQ